MIPSVWPRCFAAESDSIFDVRKLQDRRNIPLQGLTDPHNFFDFTKGRVLQLLFRNHVDAMTYQEGCRHAIPGRHEAGE
jgi:hypothetical protein